jgi:DNA polymerase III epsilon subunit-like protein
MDAQAFLSQIVESARSQMSGAVVSWASPRLAALSLGWDVEVMRRQLTHLGLAWADVEQAARGRSSVVELFAGVPTNRRTPIEGLRRGGRAWAPPTPLELPRDEPPRVELPHEELPRVEVVEAPAPPAPLPAPLPAPPSRAAHWSDEGVYLAFDVETTGSTEADRVIELGLVFFKGFEPVKEVVQRYNAQGRAIDPYAARTHGITAAQLRGCPPIDRDLARVHGWLSRAPAVVAHNMPYDRRMLGYELLRAGLEWPSGPKLIDTLVLAKRANPSKKRGYTLKDVCWLYQVPLDRHHSALHERGVRL